MRTNRDLYVFVVGLEARHATAELSLERYLCALWSLGRARCGASVLTLDELAALLDGAFTAPVGDPVLDTIADGEGFAGWEHRILHQIRDLRDMAAGGQLADDQRYFGIDAPRGGRWYNFDPLGYLECATVGTFGGWEEDDASGRVLVPGKVAVLDPTGALVSVDPSALVEPTTVIETVDWDTFTAFLECGQFYE